LDGIEAQVQLDKTLYDKVNLFITAASVKSVNFTRSKTMSEKVALGIDIAKEKYDVYLEVGGKAKKKRFANSPDGYAQLSVWLKHLGVEHVHACMEATGTYGEALAEYLYGLEHTVSVVNPARIKGYAQSQMKRHKTDELDAEVIWHFCKTQAPEAWEPPKPEIKALRGLVRRLDDLVVMRTQETNRLQSGALTDAVRTSIEQMLAYLEQQITDLERQIEEHIDQNSDLKHQIELIISIRGLGKRTAIKLVAEFMNIAGYADARSLAASVGVTPSQHKSGSSVNSTTRISKVGNAALRGAMWWPAVSAMRYNPVIREFAARLRKAKKHNFAIIIAVIRKLLHLVYGVIKNDKPFDPNWIAQKA
jgi:transposase